MENANHDGVGFVKFLMEEKGLAPSTIGTYYKYFRLLPDVITQQSIKEFVIKRKNNFGVRGFTKAYLMFKGLDREITLPPKAVGRKKQRLIRDITPQEIDAIKEFLYQTNYRSALIFDLMVQGALRISEVTTLKINSFNWKEWINDPEKMGRLKIEGKGNKEREILIFPETMQEILNQLSNKVPEADIDFIVNQNTLLFNDITQIRVYRIIKKASTKVIQRDIRPHELRHYQATQLFKRGVREMYIKEFLGHSSLAITEIYLHTSSKEALNVIEDNIMKNKKGSSAGI